VRCSNENWTFDDYSSNSDNNPAIDPPAIFVAFSGSEYYYSTSSLLERREIPEQHDGVRVVVRFLIIMVNFRSKRKKIHKQTRTTKVSRKAQQQICSTIALENEKSILLTSCRRRVRRLLQIMEGCSLVEIVAMMLILLGWFLDVVATSHFFDTAPSGTEETKLERKSGVPSFTRDRWTIYLLLAPCCLSHLL